MEHCSFFPNVLDWFLIVMLIRSLVRVLVFENIGFLCVSILCFSQPYFVFAFRSQCDINKELGCDSVILITLSLLLLVAQR